MKQMYRKTSNNQLNIPMTVEEWDVVTFIEFESCTSVTYPFGISFDDVTMDMIDMIVSECNGNTENTDMINAVCERILGINKMLIKE